MVVTHTFNPSLVGRGGQTSMSLRYQPGLQIEFHEKLSQEKNQNEGSPCLCRRDHQAVSTISVCL